MLPHDFTGSFSSPILSTEPGTSVIYPLSYTTLFRSLVAIPYGEGYDRVSPLAKLLSNGTGFRRAAVTEDVLPSELQDRKSTRLNSSHLVTSYAVFCLKKNT